MKTYKVQLIAFFEADTEDEAKEKFWEKLEIDETLHSDDLIVESISSPS